LYDDLSLPTVASSSVLTVAAIAAREGRKVIAIDIGGAFLNADMAPIGVEVHMRLDRVMTSMLIQLDPSYKKYRDVNDTVVVGLDKALYDCVEASLLWYKTADFSEAARTEDRSSHISYRCYSHKDARSSHRHLGQL
jgi:hypothetical protein